MSCLLHAGVKSVLYGAFIPSGTEHPFACLSALQPCGLVLASSVKPNKFSNNNNNKTHRLFLAISHKFP